MTTMEKIIIANLIMATVNIVGMIITTVFRIDLPSDKIFFASGAVVYAAIVIAALRYL